MVEPYGEGDSAETFKYSLFLVLCNRLTSCMVAIVSLVVSAWTRPAQPHHPSCLTDFELIPPSDQSNGKMSEIKPVAPIYTYAAVSLSNVIATTCQYEALKYVSFPVQTLVSPNLVCREAR